MESKKYVIETVVWADSMGWTENKPWIISRFKGHLSSSSLKIDEILTHVERVFQLRGKHE